MTAPAFLSPRQKDKMMKKLLLAGICVFILADCPGNPDQQTGTYRPNVLLIIVDDEDPPMNVLENDQIRTPSFRKLAGRSTVFSSAHCAAPACAPSRAAMLTGVAPYRSGSYYNNHNLWKTDSEYASVDNLPAWFRKNGYLAAGFGKVFHAGHDELTRSDWTEGYYVPYDGHRNHVELRRHVPGVTMMQHEQWHFGPLPDEWDRDDPEKMQQDTENANRVIGLLNEEHDRPFFIALGIYKPHVPYHVAQRYYDMYPPGSIEIPAGYKADDLDDVPYCAKWLATRRGFHKYITDNNLWKQVLQAKMASVTYSDEQVGRVLEALEKSRYRNNTIVWFTGDNGFHTGEKDHWSKFALWEKATRVPMMVSLPGQKESRKCPVPVSMLDIYPSLVDLCGLPDPGSHRLDGTSLAGMLKGSSGERGEPVLCTHGRDTVSYTHLTLPTN